MVSPINKRALEAFCNHVIQAELQSDWEPALVEPVNKHTATFARLYIEQAERSALDAVATELEASLNLCGTTHLQTLAIVTALVEELYELLDRYQQSE